MASKNAHLNPTPSDIISNIDGAGKLNDLIKLEGVGPVLVITNPEDSIKVLNCKNNVSGSVKSLPVESTDKVNDVGVNPDGKLLKLIAGLPSNEIILSVKLNSYRITPLIVGPPVTFPKAKAWPSIVNPAIKSALVVPRLKRSADSETVLVPTEIGVVITKVPAIRTHLLQ
jgi:hypothetical protein